MKPSRNIWYLLLVYYTFPSTKITTIDEKTILINHYKNKNLIKFSMVIFYHLVENNRMVAALLCFFEMLGKDYVPVK